MPDVNKVLWTGGWDSTFRVLWLLLAREAVVEPFYLIDPTRRSLGHEIRAMAKLKAALRVGHPAAAERLYPTRFFDITDLPLSSAIHNGYTTLCQRMSIGIQYEWLAGYCELQGLDGLELCIQKTGKDPSRETGSQGLVSPYLLYREENGERYAVIDPRHRGEDIHTIFGRLRFPLLEITKREMARIAFERGFADLMELTWFCHRPTRHNQPCGTCSPCRQVMELDMKQRMPWGSRVRYYCNRTWRRPNTQPVRGT